jgi:hypothetical protein
MELSLRHSVAEFIDMYNSTHPSGKLSNQFAPSQQSKIARRRAHLRQTRSKQQITKTIAKRWATTDDYYQCATDFVTQIHFRPILRPYTDPSLGHCSYLNTCFSEPTYSMSPSIHPLPAAPRPPGAALPSGLGAGGRGKDKAPCRYLHFEVDYDGPEQDGNLEGESRSTIALSHPRKIPREARLPIGLGPDGKLTEPVGISFPLLRFGCKDLYNVPPVSAAVDKLRPTRF